ncbi:MAG: FitA-like ribbon-helix-helix domain-containing protein [Thermodesulfobacteriota bacterium]|nr:hypothetical protein [Desulfovibrio sp.]
MAQILVRDLDEGVVSRLKALAADHNRSLEAEVRVILSRASARKALDHQAAAAKLEEFRTRLTGRVFPDSVELLREDRDA